MVWQTLAVADIGESIGYAVALFLLPAVGLLLLILGVRRNRANLALQPPPPPPWQQSGPPGYPPGYYPPPQQGLPGAPPGFYPPPPPPLGPPPPQNAGGTVMIVLGCVLMVLGLLGAGLTALGAAGDVSTGAGSSGVQMPSTPGSSDGLQVGQCITDQQYASAEMAPTPTDCSERDAVYELASHGTGPTATCPDGLREDSGYAVLFNSSTTFCFVLNVGEGECFYVDPGAQLFSPVDCTDPAANSKIDKIFDGTDDLSLCPAGPQGAAFPEPARTYCVVPPD
ncbi:MAG: hypothetical protein ABWY45_09535 [Mycobacterium sp.]